VSRRAKIVCTLGPASSSREQVAGLVAAGLDVARLNMSHGTRGDHLRAYQAVRAASDEAGRSVGVLVDLQGPKIRLGTFADGPAVLRAGQEFTITADDVPGGAGEAATTYPGLSADVGAGDQILVDDGRVVLEVVTARGGRVRTRVLVGGVVSDHKGLNVPGVKLNVPALGPKDEQDLRWALSLRADIIALSFVQGPEDAAPVRKIMDEQGVRLPLIAKIEKPQAVAALPEVLEAFDGLDPRRARGSLRGRGARRWPAHHRQRTSAPIASVSLRCTSLATSPTRDRPREGQVPEERQPLGAALGRGDRQAEDSRQPSALTQVASSA
jgi:pyruvate kinase